MCGFNARAGGWVRSSAHAHFETLQIAGAVSDCGHRLLVQPSPLMLLATLLATAALTPANEGDFSQAYGVWISVDRRSCTYWLTDTGMNPRQLTDALAQNGYEVGRGAEILTTSDTPVRCVREATRAVRRAGFVSIRTRLGTEKDRMHGIP